MKACVRENRKSFDGISFNYNINSILYSYIFILHVIWFAIYIGFLDFYLVLKWKMLIADIICKENNFNFYTCTIFIHN